MEKTAEPSIYESNQNAGEAQLGAVIIAKGATAEDARDMRRMGKVQETRRNFKHLTILGFCMVILSTWEAILSTAIFALSNGGTAGLIWGYLIVMVGFGFVIASLAEMASMSVYHINSTTIY